MKVVLFCGGVGLRLGDGSVDMPKPMLRIGGYPLIWHVMRYYAHFGYSDFVLAMGSGSKHIVSWFREYGTILAGDFVLSSGRTRLLEPNTAGWTITFAHTGSSTGIGERLRRVRQYLEGEEIFLANYADILTDAPLDEIMTQFESSDAVAAMLAVLPQNSFDVVSARDDRVSRIYPVSELPIYENGGYFIMRQEFFDHIEPGADLAIGPLSSLASAGRVMAYHHRGFWMPTDTSREQAELESLASPGPGPWELWRQPQSGPAGSSSRAGSKSSSRAGPKRPR